MSKRILIVEDEKIFRQIYADQFRSLGYQVDSVGDGEQALEFIRTKKPDLVLLDLIIPGIDGFGILKRIKQDSNLRTISVVILTVLAQDSDKLSCSELGADLYLVKTEWSMDQVIEKVNEILYEKL